MSKESILIVDDEEDILELIQYYLSRNGYSLDTAISGEEALTKAKTKLPNIIILD